MTFFAIRRLPEGKWSVLGGAVKAKQASESHDRNDFAGMALLLQSPLQTARVFFLRTLEHMNSQTHQNFLSRHSNGKSYISDCALLFQNLHPRHEQWRIEWGAIDSWQGSCGLLLCRVVECVQWQYDIDLIACIYRLHCVCITMYYIDLTLWYVSAHTYIYIWKNHTQMFTSYGVPYPPHNSRP